MIIFVVLELVAVAAETQYCFRFRIGWRHCLQNAKKLSANQISTIYLNLQLRYN